MDFPGEFLSNRRRSGRRPDDEKREEPAREKSVASESSGLTYQAICRSRPLPTTDALLDKPAVAPGEKWPDRGRDLAATASGAEVRNYRPRQD